MNFHSDSSGIFKMVKNAQIKFYAHQLFPTGGNLSEK